MLIKVKAFPDSSKEEIIQKKDYLEIRVKQKPVQGMANKRIIQMLCSKYNARVKLIKGFNNKNKVFEIYD